MTLMSSWRPVTILNASSKIFEKIIHEQLIEHLEKNGLLPPQQYAYRESRSTTAALLEIETVARVGMDRGKCVSLLLVDLSAAFDCIDADVVCSKLKLLGVGKHAVKLIRSYLTNRYARTKINDCLS